MGIDAEMFVRVPRALTATEVRRESVKLVTAFGSERFFIYRPGEGYGGDLVNGRHALEIVSQYEQDAPTIVPEPGETFVRVAFWGRYYGPGYERGDLVTILAVARWLRLAFAPCTVWYGGDSSGVEARPLDEAYEAELLAHFQSTAGRAYFTEMRSTFDTAKPHHCDFCDVDCPSNGGGAGVTFYYCTGCDGAWERNNASGKVAARNRNDRGDAQNVPRAQWFDALLDVLARHESDLATITDVTCAIRNGTRLTITTDVTWRNLSHDARVQLYERAVESIAKRQRALERAA